jgi:hypothetical protein
MTIARKKLGIAFGALAAFGLMGASALPVGAATTPPTCAHQLKVVKTAWTKAPVGAKKDTAKGHYDMAVADHKKKDDKGCLTELDAAMTALK